MPSGGSGTGGGSAGTTTTKQLTATTQSSSGGGQVPLQCKGIAAGPQGQCNLATPPATSSQTNTPPLQPSQAKQFAPSLAGGQGPGYGLYSL